MTNVLEELTEDKLPPLAKGIFFGATYNVSVDNFSFLLRDKENVLVETPRIPRVALEQNGGKEKDLIIDYLITHGWNKGFFKR